MSNLSPAPGTPQTSTKATAAAVAGFLIAFLGSLIASVQGREDLETLGTIEWLIIIGTAVVTAGGAYGAAYQAKNRALP